MIEKKASPKGKTVQVTFALPADVAAESVAVVGDFNEWSTQKHTMKLNKKKGVWTKAISLKPGDAYQFRYYIDGGQWRNDEAADRYVSNSFFTENSVLEL